MDKSRSPLEIMCNVTMDVCYAPMAAIRVGKMVMHGVGFCIGDLLEHIGEACKDQGGSYPKGYNVKAYTLPGSSY